MRFENLQIQLVDTPPIQPDRVESGFSNLVRIADALLLVLDLSGDALFQMEVLQETLTQMRVRIVSKGAFPTVPEGWVHRKGLLLGNKCDLKNAIEEYQALANRYGQEFVLLPLSAKEGMNFEELKREVYQLLDIIRVYTKVPGREADLSEPVVLRKESTVGDVALTIHKDFAANLKYARIWGSGKFNGQMVKRDFRLREGDVIEFHI